MEVAMSEAPHVLRRLGATEGVHRAVDLARRASQGYGSTQVDTEHLLLGLLQQRKRRKNLVAWCLGEFDVTEHKVREQIERARTLNRRAGEEVEFAFGSHLRRVVERAREEARQLGVAYLGTEHLLLGLLGESDGGAAQILSDLDVDRNRARRTVMRKLGVGA